MKTYLHTKDFAALCDRAGREPRLRTHLNTHDTPEADVQRLFIATSPGTYIRPHRHSERHKWEFFLLLEGEMDLLLFDDDGRLVERSRLSPVDIRAVEIPPGQWHSYVCRKPGTLAFEVKQGAYVPTAAEDFAPWSPAENADAARACLEWMQLAPVGSRFDSNMTTVG